MTKALYVGQGEFIPGVPARDLTEDEWLALDGDTQALALDSGLYVAGD